MCNRSLTTLNSLKMTGVQVLKLLDGLSQVTLLSVRIAYLTCIVAITRAVLRLECSLDCLCPDISLYCAKNDSTDYPEILWVCWV